MLERFVQILSLTTREPMVQQFEVFRLHFKVFVKYLRQGSPITFVFWLRGFNFRWAIFIIAVIVYVGVWSLGNYIDLIMSASVKLQNMYVCIIDGLPVS